MAGSSYTIYVTFHGGPGATNNVCAIPWSGSAPSTPLNNPPATVLAKAPSGYNYDEMRGMALDDEGLLYVANGARSSSAVYVFSTAVNGVRSAVAVLLANPANLGIDHPYGLALVAAAGGGGKLFVSNQNSNAVCAYTVTGGATPAASALPVVSYLTGLDPTATFYPGETVASQLGVTEGSITPPGVPGPAGLSMSWNPNSHAEPDDSAHGAHAAKKKKKKKKPVQHSVRGVLCADGGTLFVASENDDSVNLYNSDTGAYLGQITGLDKPVGLAYDGGSLVYIATQSAIFTCDLTGANLTTVASGLDEVSGILVGPDGNVFYASRASNAVYVLVLQQEPQIDGLVTGPLPIATGFSDQPECLLSVPA